MADFTPRERLVKDPYEAELHRFVVSEHRLWVARDPDFVKMPIGLQQGRIRSESRGLFTFLESGVQTGDYVDAEYHFNQSNLEIDGYLEVVQPEGMTHPMWLMIDRQRVRFRALNWIEKSEE